MADLIIHNATIYTVDGRNSIAEAIAIGGGRIVAVGSDAEVMRHGAAGTRVIDAKQAAVIPGLHDAHADFIGLGESLQTVDLRGTTSYADVIDPVRRRVATVGPGEWVQGRGWDQNDWADKQW